MRQIIYISRPPHTKGGDGRGDSGHYHRRYNKRTTGWSLCLDNTGGGDGDGYGGGEGNGCGSGSAGSLCDANNLYNYDDRFFCSGGAGWSYQVNTAVDLE